MKFLIIGGSGFLGRHLTSYIKSLGYQVVGTQSQSKYPNLVTFDLLRHRITDCIEDSFFKTGPQVYAVICAMISQIDRCVLERETSYKVNVENTILLIEDLLSLGVKPLFISSNFVYDGIDGYYDEQQTRHPINEYGRQKLAVENFIESRNADALVLRLDKMVGDNPFESHLFSEWYGLLRNENPIVCIQEMLFAPTWVEDVAKAITLGCQKGLSGFYNVANTEFFYRDELARHFVASLGEKCEIISKPQDEFNFLDPRTPKAYMDPTKFVDSTGMRFTPMRKVFRSFKNNLHENK